MTPAFAVVPPMSNAIESGTDHARGGTGLEHAHAIAARMRQREQAAGRLHGVEVPLKALGFQVRFELAQVGRDTRSDIGIGHGGGDALEFAVLLRELVRRAHKGARNFLLQDGFHAALMVGVQQQDRHGFDLVGAQLARQRAHALLVQRFVQRAIGAQSLAHFEALRARHQGHMLGEEQVVGVGPIDTTDLVDVAKPLGDQQGRAGPVAFEQRVDGDGGAMQEQVAVGQVDARTVERVLNALVQVAMGGQGLAKGDLARGLVKAGHVGEGAADVDGHAQRGRSGGHGSSFKRWRRPPHCAACPDG